MIKDFEITDLGYFLPNEYSDPDAMLHVFDHPDVVKKTLWHEGMVAAFLIFRNYWGNCWDGCFLISRDFPPRLAVVIKRYIKETMDHYGAVRLQSDGRACEEIRAWHKFLGFAHEGCRRKMVLGNDYDMFAIVRES